MRKLMNYCVASRHDLKSNRNFRLVLIGTLVPSVGDVLFSFTMVVYILAVTHATLMLSIYEMIGCFTWLILVPFGGA